MVREAKVTFEQRCEGNKSHSYMWRKNLPGKGNDKYKGPKSEFGMFREWQRNQCGWNGSEQGGEITEMEVREVAKGQVTCRPL